MATEIVQPEASDLSSLNHDTVVDFFFGNARVKPSANEVAWFIEVCKKRKLNPLLKDIYLIKYDADKPASWVVGKDALIKRASNHPDFQGMDAGIVLKRGNEIVHVEGALYFPGDVLLGGWAKVYRKNLARPISSSVAVSEYHSKQSTWNKMPATMTRKTALSQALREAFPEEFGGLYDASEMQQAEQYKNVDLLELTNHEIVPENIQLPEGLSDSIDESVPEADMMCPIHQREWFKSPNMQEYSHAFDYACQGCGQKEKKQFKCCGPVEWQGEVGPRGGKIWCNQSRVMEDISKRMKDIVRSEEWDAEVIAEWFIVWKEMTNEQKLQYLETYQNKDDGEALVEDEDEVTVV